jgi:hypothetical protein
MPRNNDDDFEPRPRRGRYEDDDERDLPPPRKSSNVGVILLIVGGVLLLVCGGGGALMIWGIRSAAKNVQQNMAQMAKEMEEQQQTAESRANLNRIGVAMHAYNDEKGALPNNSYEQRGRQSRPLLSWRVHILPYLGHGELYKKFNLNEPWDSPTNRPQVVQMPGVYAATDTRANAGVGRTYYRGFSHPGAIFEKPRNPGDQVPRVSLQAILDGTANTIFVVDAGEAIEWTKPEDIDWSPGRPRPTLGGAYPNLTYCLVLFASGEVREMRKAVPDQTLRNLIDRQDGNVIPDDWEHFDDR